MQSTKLDLNLGERIPSRHLRPINNRVNSPFREGLRTQRTGVFNCCDLIPNFIKNKNLKEIRVIYINININKKILKKLQKIHKKVYMLCFLLRIKKLPAKAANVYRTSEF